MTQAARMLPHFGITSGFALELTVDDEDVTPWDIDDQQKRNKSVRNLLVEVPDLLL